MNIFTILCIFFFPEMSELYSFSKTRGCIALKDIKKGTMIVSDYPKCNSQGLFRSIHPDVKSGCEKVVDLEAQSYVKGILSSFSQMCLEDQEEYMNLFNKYDDIQAIPQAGVELRYFESLVRRSGEKFDEKKVKIISIFVTNSFGYPVLSNTESFAPRLTQSTEGIRGVPIKISQFRHSCRPNAAIKKCYEKFWLQAITKIKAGEEITFSHYQSPTFGMFPLETRRRHLFKKFYFMCKCEYCGAQEDVIMQENEIQTATRLVNEDQLIEFLGKEAEIRGKFEYLYNRKDLPDFKEYYTENSSKAREYIDCVKKLYDYGKEKKVQPICVYSLLAYGYWISAMIFQLTEHKWQRKFFEKEAINFANMVLKFEKILGSEFVGPEYWKKCSDELNPSGFWRPL